MSIKAKIRRTQTLHTHGIGSILTNDKNESLLILSMQDWKYNKKRFNLIREPRLTKFLKVNNLLYAPETGKQNYIKAIRFPGWHFCNQAKCGWMKFIQPNHNISKCENSKCYASKNNKQSLIPVRFLTVCTNGHIDDFPFIKYVHNGIDEKGHQLTYSVNTYDSSTAGIWIRCLTCDAKPTSMQKSLLPKGLENITTCNGYKHWAFNESLESNKENCVIEDENTYKYQGIQKGASNLYFPILRSSIWIPENDGFPESLKDFFLEPSTMLILDNSAMNEEAKTTFINSWISNDQTVDFKLEDVFRYYQYLKNPPDSNTDESYESMQYDEYSTFMLMPGLTDNRDYQARILESSKYEKWFSQYFSSITMIEKLRETVAFCGFTRFYPYSEGQHGDIHKKIKEINLNGSDLELPASINRGEGIFLQFNKESLNKWEENTDIEKYLINNSVIHDEIRDLDSAQRFIMMHTFAHLLINEISIECGYASSSLKERIYCNTYQKNYMGGILIYTSDGDSEGSLGGLVRLGKPGKLEILVYNALNKAKWCSSDPICCSIGTQGPHRLNIAACHNCSIVSETSCNHFNKSLDRNLVVNTYKNLSFNYFNI